MKRKITSIVLVLTMLAALMPAIPVYAADKTVGTGGDYATLAAALAAANTGDTIILSSNVTETAAYEFDTSGKTITIDGQSHQLTGAGGSNSSALALKGNGTVTLNNITLQGGTATATNGISTGLKVSDSTNVQSLGTVSCCGGLASHYGYSNGVWLTGSGIVNVTTATGGDNSFQSCGVRSEGSGTVNVTTARGGTGNTSSNLSAGVWAEGNTTVNVAAAISDIADNSYGVDTHSANCTVNVKTAISGVAAYQSFGVSNWGGTININAATSATAGAIGATADINSFGVIVGNVNATVNVKTATGGTAIGTNSESYGVYQQAGTVNVNTATGGTALRSAAYSGTVNSGAAITLTLNKETGADCVLDSITVAASGSTKVGALPQVTKNGIQGAWYTDVAKTTVFSGTTVNSETTLYSTFYEPPATYTMSASALTSFGSLTAGYTTAPTARTVTVTNTGNQIITLAEPATTNASSNYAIGALSSPTLATDSSVTFAVQPKTGLAVGTYNETINISGTSGAAASVSVQFSVTAADNGGGGGSHGGGSTVTTPADTPDTPIKFNGQSENAGKTVASTDGGKTVTTVTLDDAKIQEKIKTEDKGTVVSIPISGSSDIGQGVLNGQTVKDMEKKESVLEIKTGSATYSLPASEINIDSVSSQFGQSVKLEDIKISVKIEAPTAGDVKIVADTANENNYQVVVKPVEFEITCTSGSKTVAVSKFNSYVERMVAIPDGIDPGKVTTGVVLNKDGTFSHVPTAIVKIDGKYYAKINSLTNSTYSVIYNPVAFADVAAHWAKASINNMGSRLVISGVGENKFEPNRDITRAEFAAIMVRALGLAPDTAKNTFSDVSASSWYVGYVGTAASYGIISGYDADTFAPNAKITREQAMTMVARAMAITGLTAAAADNDARSPLTGYADTAKISSYAKAGITACLDTGVVTGKTADTIAPKNNITRAEVAVIIERLLEKSELI